MQGIADGAQPSTSSSSTLVAPGSCPGDWLSGSPSSPSPLKSRLSWLLSTLGLLLIRLNAWEDSDRTICIGCDWLILPSISRLEGECLTSALWKPGGREGGKG